MSMSTISTKWTRVCEGHLVKINESSRIGFFHGLFEQGSHPLPQSFFYPSHSGNNTQHSECKNVDLARLLVSTTGKKF